MRHLYVLIALMATLLTALMMALVTGTASAQTAASPDQAKAKLAEMDLNHDGALSLDEWKAAGRRERGFKMIDADGDGKVTIAELQAARAKYGRGG